MIHKFNFIEKILLNKNIIPHPLIDAAENIGLAKALGTAVKLGITDHLTSELKSDSQISDECSLSEKGTAIILDCLEALGYTKKINNSYKFSKRGQKFLDKKSPANLVNYILYASWSYGSFDDLEETVKNGVPGKTNLSSFNEHQWELFTRAMIDLAKMNLSEVIKKITIPVNAKKIIDLGGSHGLYSIELCKKKNDLSAAVLDFEPVKKYFDERIKNNPVKNRVKFQICDFMKDPLPEENDISLLFNIIHGMDEKQNKYLFAKIYNVLLPGGQLIILDQIKKSNSGTQLSRATTSFMALNLFHHAGGNTYSFEEVKHWSNLVGFQNTKLIKLSIPGVCLIICKK